MPFCQQTNLVKFSSPKLKLVLQLPAKNFKEIVKTKCDNHKILDNFRQIKNYSEECPRHHTTYNVYAIFTSSSGDQSRGLDVKARLVKQIVAIQKIIAFIRPFSSW